MLGTLSLSSFAWGHPRRVFGGEGLQLTPGRVQQWRQSRAGRRGAQGLAGSEPSGPLGWLAWALLCGGSRQAQSRPRGQAQVPQGQWPLLSRMELPRDITLDTFPHRSPRDPPGSAPSICRATPSPPRPGTVAARPRWGGRPQTRLAPVQHPLPGHGAGILGRLGPSAPLPSRTSIPSVAQTLALA